MLELSNLSRETRLHANSLGPLGHSRLSSLNHRGLILVYKQEFVCVSWSPPEKKSASRGMNRRTFLQNPRERGKSHHHQELSNLAPCWYLLAPRTFHSYSGLTVSATESSGTGLAPHVNPSTHMFIGVTIDEGLRMDLADAFLHSRNVAVVDRILRKITRCSCLSLENSASCFIPRTKL